MATQMPIPPDFDRFIEPMSDEEVEAAGPSALTMFDEMEDETPEVEELPDGSAIVRMEDDSKGPDGEPDFYMEQIFDADDTPSVEIVCSNCGGLAHMEPAGARYQRAVPAVI